MTKEFSDNPNTAVFTTKYILEQHSPVLSVYHYENDGAWSFSGCEKCEDGDYRVISLEEMINIDNSILELADMPLGFCAKRNSITSLWEIEHFDEDLS
jgi:Uncharacterized protein conserved in bacteria